MLKAGHCTMLFNAFLIGKTASMTMKGGNTSEVYEVDNPGGKDTRSGEKFDKRFKFAKSIWMQHKDITNIVQKYNRWHHYVDYYKFKQRPVLRAGLNIPKRINEYGLVLKEYPKPIKEGVING